MADVAHGGRASGCGPEGSGFDPRRSPHVLLQFEDRHTSDEGYFPSEDEVIGSSPVPATRNDCRVAQLVERVNFPSTFIGVVFNYGGIAKSGKGACLISTYTLVQIQLPLPDRHEVRKGLVSQVRPSGR
jgi:hypothetical protein